LKPSTQSKPTSSSIFDDEPTQLKSAKEEAAKNKGTKKKAEPPPVQTKPKALAVTTPSTFGQEKKASTKTNIFDEAGDDDDPLGLSSKIASVGVSASAPKPQEKKDPDPKPVQKKTSSVSIVDDDPLGLSQPKPKAKSASLFGDDSDFVDPLRPAGAKKTGSLFDD